MKLEDHSRCRPVRLIAQWLLPALVISGVVDARAADDEFLPPEQAFQYAARAEDDELVVTWTVEPGYYLYRKRMGFSSSTEGVTVAEAVWPQGEMHEDEFFGRQEIYRGATDFRFPLRFASERPGQFSLDLKLQGCADAGLCYPPTTWTTTVALATPAAARADLRSLLRAGAQDDEFLPPDEAFRFSARMERPDAVTLQWIVAEGYYLYRDKFAVHTDSTLVTLGTPLLPQGERKIDEFFGETQVLYDIVEATLPLARPAGERGAFELEVAYQGCAEAGLCYPVIRKSVMVTLPPTDTPATLAAAGGSAGRMSEQDRLAQRLANGETLWTILAFFGFGALLAFTPCVLPMIPILSGVVIGQGGRSSAGHAFALSLAYVLAMALTYTAAGVLAGLFGANLQIWFQNPWVLSGFAAVFVLLALSMFGFYELQMPSSLQTRLTEISSRERGRGLLGAALMGLLSALIVGPCVTAPLIGALIYIGQTGDAVLGGAALFALSLGMGAPLIAIGTSAGKLLPKAGPWMNAVKAVFGVIMLGVALWLLERILPVAVTMLLAGALLVVSGIYMGAFDDVAAGDTGWRRLWKGLGLVVFVYGGTLLVGAASGSQDLLQPLRAITNSGGVAESSRQLVFRRIKTTAALDQALNEARTQGRPVMFDFYADWCVSCKEMEHYTFSDPAVRAALAGAMLLQADVTANDADDQALLSRFEIFGPPTIAFFDAAGRELRAFRVVGYMPAAEFAGHVSEAFSGIEP